MTQGVIAEWCKKEGEVIKAGDCIAKVETDKATVDVRARLVACGAGLAPQAARLATPSPPHPASLLSAPTLSLSPRTSPSWGAS